MKGIVKKKKIIKLNSQEILDFKLRVKPSENDKELRTRASYIYIDGLFFISQTFSSALMSELKVTHLQGHQSHT